MRDKPIPKELISEWLRYAPMLTCNVVIEEDGYVLLVKRKHPPEKDKWFTPGGIITKKDYLVHNQAKWIAEQETGMRLIIEHHPSSVDVENFNEGYGATDIQLITLVYYANPLPPKQIPTHDEEHSDIRWFELDECAPWWVNPKEEIIGEGVQGFITEALKER